MTRPTPTSGARLGVALFALLLAAASPSLADTFEPVAPEEASGAATTLLPSTTLPSTTLPSTTLPSTTLPSTTLPSTTLPSTTLPSTTLPGTTTAPPPLEPLDIPPAFNAEEAGGFLWSFVKSMLMLGVVLALIYLVLHKGLGRLVQRTQVGRRMRVVERIALDQRRALYLVEVDGQEVLLAASEGGVVAVDMSKTERAKAQTPAAPAAPFSTDLGKTGRQPPLTGVLREDGGSKVHTAGVRDAATAAREGLEG